MNTDMLSKEIESVFPFVEMPNENELTFHDVGCEECKGLQGDLEQYRGNKITGETIRLIHQELSLLSAKALRWILPYYLRYCLTQEGVYNQMETQFLIYNLDPDLKFQHETLQRFSILNRSQISCLIHFLEWCASQPYWKEFCPDSLTRGMDFLKKIEAQL